jgi:hypothetical protein
LAPKIGDILPLAYYDRGVDDIGDAAIRLLDARPRPPPSGGISNDVGTVKGHVLRSGRRSRLS